MSSLITTEESLRKFIPNVLVSVKGETSLLDKLDPFLIMTEQWLAHTFTSGTIFEGICLASDSVLLRIYASKAVVSQAFMQAVPSLDLVLTPNGFGIVSNANVVPASKERIERLIASLEQERDAAIQLMLTALASSEEWRSTIQYGYFESTMFPNLDLCDHLGIREHRWQKYQELRPRIIEIETELAHNYISEDLLQVLRSEVMAPSSESVLKKVVIRGLRSEIVRMLRTNTDTRPTPSYHLRDFSRETSCSNLLHIVDIIKKNPDEFPEWHSSPVAELFAPKVFENKKHDKGYWF